MPGAVALAVRIGFAGKLPARGDFCTRGLPRSFCDPWDAWLAEAMTGSREMLGEDWLPAWLEAPVWRFTLPAGHCGPEPAAGVMLPSVDKAGRHWPLMLGAVGCSKTPEEAWFDALEDAGMEAVLADAAPERVEAMLAEIGDSALAPLFSPSPPNGGRGLGEGGATRAEPRSEARADPPSPSPLPPKRERVSGAAGEGSSHLATWRTIGAPRVAPRAFTLGALPGAAAFATMLTDSAAA